MGTGGSQEVAGAGGGFVTWWQSILVVLGLLLCVSPFIYAYSWFMVDLHRMNKRCEELLEERDEED